MEDGNTEQPAAAAASGLERRRGAPAVRRRRRHEPDPRPRVHARRHQVVASAAEPTPMRVLGPGPRRARRRGALAGPCSRSCAGWWPSCPTRQAIRGVAVASVGEAGVLLGDDGAAAGTDHRLVRHPHHGRARLAAGGGRLRAAAPDHRAVRRPDLQPAQAAVADGARRRSCSPPRGAGSTSATTSPGACAASGRPTSASPRARSCSTSSGAPGRRRCWRPPGSRPRCCRRCCPSGTGIGHAPARGRRGHRPAGRLRGRRRRPRPCLRPDRGRRRRARACCWTAWAPPRR